MIHYDEPGTEKVNYDHALKSVKYRTRLERLKDAKKGLEVKLKEINEAIEALEANPEFTKLMELLERVGI